MTPAPAPVPQGPAAWVSVEGINGVGKTYLAARAAAALGQECLPLAELPDSPGALLPGQIIAALHSRGDAFLRTGHPRTETLLLAALQVHRHEALLTEAAGRIVLEDRGPHSVAAYQAVILTAGDIRPCDGENEVRWAFALTELIGRWRPMPQATLLLTDDPARCLARFQQRTGRRVTADEHALITRIGHLYERLAGAFGMRVLDRRELDEQDCVTAIIDTCQALARERTCP